MNFNNIADRIDFLTGTTVNEYTLNNRLISLNKWYNNVHSWILQAQDDWDFDDQNQTDFPIVTTDLVANQQDYGGLYLESMVKIQRVEITYDGTNWYRMTSFDKNQDGNAMDTTSVANDFDTTSPYYRLVGNSIFVYPIPTTNVTDGLKVYIDRSVIEFTSDTAGDVTPGFDVQFHDILPLGAAYDWNSIKKGDKSLIQDIMDLKEDLQKHYSTKLVDKQYSLTPNIEDYS